MGCSWVPSPALSTWASIQRDACHGAPDAWCRMTMAASLTHGAAVGTVSLAAIRLLTPIGHFALMIDHPRRATLPAISNEDRGCGWSRTSENKLTTVRPRSAGNFFDGTPLYRTTSPPQGQDLGDLIPIKISCGEQMAHQAPLRSGPLPGSMVT